MSENYFQLCTIENDNTNSSGNLLQKKGYGWMQVILDDYMLKCDVSNCAIELCLNKCSLGFFKLNQMSNCGFNFNAVTCVQLNEDSYDRSVNGKTYRVDDTGKIIMPSYPTDNCQLGNGCGYINKSISDLENYYTSSCMNSCLSCYAYNINCGNSCVCCSNYAFFNENNTSLTQIDVNTCCIEKIESYIPNETSCTNQLADKDYVNTCIETNSANFRGNYSLWSCVYSNAECYPVDYANSSVPTTNDYMVVQDAFEYTKDNQNVVSQLTVDGSIVGRRLAEDLTVGETTIEKNDVITVEQYDEIIANNITTITVYKYDGTWRFKYVGTWDSNGKNGWNPEYRINETPFTTSQLNAINSGVTMCNFARNVNCANFLSESCVCCALNSNCLNGNLAKCYPLIAQYTNNINCSCVHCALNSNCLNGYVGNSYAMNVNCANDLSTSCVCCALNTDCLGGCLASCYQKSSDVFNSCLRICVNNIEVGHFTANQNSDSGINISVPTDNCQLENSCGYAKKTDIYNCNMCICVNGSCIGKFTGNQSSNSGINISVPTNNCQLTNGCGYITNTVNNLTNYYNITCLNNCFAMKCDITNNKTKSAYCSCCDGTYGILCLY